MVLVCALMLLLAAMAIGVAVARGAFGALAAARNERDREVARAAAEAALRDAERDIAGGAAASPDRSARFAADAEDFAAGCGHGASDLGLCRAALPPAWQDVDLAAAAGDVLVPYGRYTGATLATGHGLLPARLPAYLIERIEPPGATAAQGSFYRISAIGFGTRAATQVVLQSLYRKPAPTPTGGGDTDAGRPDPAGPGPRTGGADDGGAAPGPVEAGGDTPASGDPGAGDPAAGDPAAGDPAAGDPAAGDPAPGGPGTGATDAPGPAPAPPARPPPHPLPAGRIGWREIANWPELHARARH